MVDVRSFNVKGLTSADQYDRRISNEEMGIERHTALKRASGRACL